VGEAVDFVPEPVGLGRKIRNAAMLATIIPMMMKTISGLGKLVLLPGGRMGDSMVV
jgi:hypothetical protein